MTKSSRIGKNRKGRPGRPKSPRKERLEVRLLKTTYDLIERAAERECLSVHAWAARVLARQAAKDVSK